MAELPPGLTPIAAVEPFLHYVPYQTALGAISIPLVLFLILNSTRRIRSSISFWICILCFFMSNVQIVLVCVLFASIALNPTASTTGLNYGVAFFGSSTPWYADLVMPIRLAAFYPNWRHNWRSVLPIFAFPILIKVVRFGNLINYYVYQHHRFFDESVGITDSAGKGQPPSLIAEYAMQLLDNGYISAFFIYKLQSFQAQSSARSGAHRPTSLAERISAIIGIAVASYVIPVILNVAMLITGSNPATADVYNYIVSANSCITTWNIIITTALLNRPGEKVLGATMLQSFHTQTYRASSDERISPPRSKIGPGVYSNNSLPTGTAERLPADSIRMDIVRTEEGWADDASQKA